MAAAKRLKGLRGVRRWFDGGLALRELRLLRKAAERIAGALETRNAQDYPSRLASTDAPDLSTDIAFVNDAEQAEWMEIEVRLTAATGQPPTEDEILSEYLRRHAGASPADGAH